MAATTVLVVDDSALMRQTIKQILNDAGGFDVYTARNGVDALEQIGRVQPDVITLDVNMPEMDGLSCLSKIMQDRPRPVVMVSSLTDHNALVTLEALELGAVDYVPKPGGTVSLNLDDVADELVTKVRGAASARPNRARGLTARVRAHQKAEAPPQPPLRRPAGLTELLLIGSSTGGPALLGSLLPQLPAGLSAPVVVAQHIPASFTAPLARRLDETCQLRVLEVDRTMPAEVGTIYIGRGNADVMMARRGDQLVVKTVPASNEYRWHPSVDRLVASARRVCDPRRLVCVLLTGMGDDGAAEMAAVRKEGGRTIAEAEETAVVWGMPGELARRGGASRVLPAHAIPGQLVDWVR
jgi:two-component system chemotaxis response regulator CheB